MEPARSISLRLCFHSLSLPRGFVPVPAPQRTFPRSPGGDLALALKLACLSLPQIPSLSPTIYLPGGFVWVLIQTQPFSFDSHPSGAFLYVSNVMLRSYENSKEPHYTLQQFKNSRDLMESLGLAGPERASLWPRYNADHL